MNLLDRRSAARVTNRRDTVGIVQRRNDDGSQRCEKSLKTRNAEVVMVVDSDLESAAFLHVQMKVLIPFQKLYF